MKHSLYKSLIAAASVMICTGGASAAGLDIPAPIPGSAAPAPDSAVAVPAPIPIPQYANWYLRVDGAWGVHGDPDMTVGGIGSLTNEDLESTWTVGGGVGYYFTENVRGDITVDYRFKTEASGTNTAASRDESADLSSTLVLANLYYDFGFKKRIRPYAGFGLGVSHNKTSGRISDDGGGLAFSDGEGNTGFAAAGMAGLSIALGGRWTFDTGYRFLYLGDAETDPVPGGPPGSLHIDDVTAHEFRFGLRYAIQ